MKQAVFSLAWLTLLLAVGCTSAADKDVDGAVAYQMGLRAEQANNLPAAREYYAKAETSAKSGRLGPAKQAHAAYGWARMSGYLGFYAEAEKGFERSVSLIDQAEGDADRLRAPVLFDLAQMLHDTGQHAKAVKAFDQGFAELERKPAAIEPWAFIYFLGEYAVSLKATGAAGPAAAVDQRIARLTEQAKGKPPGAPIRPYKK